MEASSITSWQIDGEKVETVTDFIFLGSKITVDSNCSHEIKRCLFSGRKAMTDLESILKSRNVTLSTKMHIDKAMFFPVVMYGCESWTLKKAECQKIDAFELWCWRILLRVPWTARRSNQSVLKEINPEGLMLKLKLQYLGQLMQRADLLQKTLILENTDSRRRVPQTLVSFAIVQKASRSRFQTTSTHSHEHSLALPFFEMKSDFFQSCVHC